MIPLEQHQHHLIAIFRCEDDGIIHPSEVCQLSDDKLPVCPFCAQELDIEFVEETQPVEVKSS